MGKITHNEKERAKIDKIKAAHHKAHADKVEKLVAETKKHFGDEMLKKLGTLPLAIAAGGVEKGIENIVKDACNECAGHPDPLAAAIRTVRVKCGLKGDAPKPAPQAKELKPVEQPADPTA